MKKLFAVLLLVLSASVFAGASNPRSSDTPSNSQHRELSWDAYLDNVPVYDLNTGEPLTPEEHRRRANDRHRHRHLPGK